MPMSFSMTGYGQSAVQFGGYKVQIEVKSVNHRYCEIVMRIPREWGQMEDSLKRLIQDAIKRGRIDVFMNKEQDTGQVPSLKLNHANVQSYLQAGQELTERYGMNGTLDINQLLALPGVMTTDQPSELADEEGQAQWQQILGQGLQEALQNLLEMRAREGIHLANDLRERLNLLEQHYRKMCELAPTVVEEHRVRLIQRLSELQDGSYHWDDSRISMEIAVFADRSNIDEELTRLNSHFQQCRLLLESNDAIGRRLDFLIQEMNREVNTIGSKANHLALTNHVVEMKAELEKVREQAANLE